MRAMTNDQILSLLSSGGKICGNINTEQLTRLNTHVEPAAPRSGLFTSVLRIAAGLAALFSYSAAVAKPAYSTEQHPIASKPSDLSSNADSTNSKVVSGTVVDHDNKALVGVSINVKGTKAFATTDAKGKFSLFVNSEDDILQFKFIGFENKELPVRKFRKSRSLTLEIKTSVLGEVVVTQATNK